MDVIVKQLELLRGTVGTNSSLSGVLGFDVHRNLSVRADTAGFVSIGSIANVLYRGMARARSMADMSDDLDAFENLLYKRAVKSISAVLSSGNDDGIVTYVDLKAKLRYFGVKSSMTDIISMMSQADIEGSGVVKVSDLSRLLARELGQLRQLLNSKTEGSTNSKTRISLEFARDGNSRTVRDYLLNGQAAYGILQRFPTARPSRKKPGRLKWSEDEDIAAVCLFDRSGTMMIQEQGELVTLPTKLDYFTDVHRSTDTRTIVELPPKEPSEEEDPPQGFARIFACCFAPKVA